MKKYSVLFFALTFVFILAGCTNKEEDKTTEVTETKTYFEATILEVSDNYLLVEPLEGTSERKSADKIKISTDDIGEEESLNYLEEAKVGDIIKIGYLGEIAESYPAQINSTFEIKLVTEAEILNDKIPMVMVNGKLYYDTGKESTITGRCGVMDGEITRTVDSTRIPTEDDQSNFGIGYEYQYGMENTIEIYMNDKWIVFEQRDGDGSTPLPED